MQYVGPQQLLQAQKVSLQALACRLRRNLNRKVSLDLKALGDALSQLLRAQRIRCARQALKQSEQSMNSHWVRISAQPSNGQPDCMTVCEPTSCMGQIWSRAQQGSDETGRQAPTRPPYVIFIFHLYGRPPSAMVPRGVRYSGGTPPV